MSKKKDVDGPRSDSEFHAETLDKRIILSRRSFIRGMSALGIAATVATLLPQGIDFAKATDTSTQDPSLFIGSTPNPSKPQQNITLTGRLGSPGGWVRRALPNSPVRIDSSLDGKNWSTLSSTQTDTSGVLTVSLATTRPTYLRAYFPGDSGYTASFSNVILQQTSRMPVGVNTWSGTPVALFNQRDSPLLSQIGVRQVRLGAVNDQNLAQYDSLVNALVANGIEVLSLLHNVDLASDHKAFGDYAYNMVLHFKDRIHNWEIWNEPNWNPATASPYFAASDYTDLLKNAYARAKQADPNSFIISGAPCSVEGGLGYLKGIYDNGGKDFMDAVAIHPYCFPAAPSDPHGDPDGNTFCGLPTIRDLMISYGDLNKKVWITEFGYRTPGIGFTAGDAKGTVTEQQQASYLGQALQMASGWDWVERFYAYQWMDDSDPSDGCWGLIRENYEPPFPTKPAFNAAKAFVASQQ